MNPGMMSWAERERRYRKLAKDELIQLLKSREEQIFFADFNNLVLMCGVLPLFVLAAVAVTYYTTH